MSVVHKEHILLEARTDASFLDQAKEISTELYDEFNDDPEKPELKVEFDLEDIPPHHAELVVTITNPYSFKPPIAVPIVLVAIFVLVLIYGALN